MIYYTAFLLIVSSFAADVLKRRSLQASEDVCPPSIRVNIGLGQASEYGFEWSYDLQISDHTYANWNIHSDLIGPGVDCPSDVNPNLEENIGLIATQHADCRLKTDEQYEFFVRVELLDEFDAIIVDCAAIDGLPVIPLETISCVGGWSWCDANCYQSYTITQWPSGTGADCEFGDGEERECGPGEGQCPLETDDSSNGIVFTEQNVNGPAEINWPHLLKDLTVQDIARKLDQATLEVQQRLAELFVLVELCTRDLCMGICCAQDGWCACSDVLQSSTVDLLKSKFEVNQCACADLGEPNWGTGPCSEVTSQRECVTTRDCQWDGLQCHGDRRKLKSRKRLLRL